MNSALTSYLKRGITIALLASGFALWSPTLSAKSQPEEDKAALEKLELFADIFARVRDNYVEDVSDKELIEAALNGALSALDPHSSYSPPAEFEEQREAVKREYGGLGIEVTSEAGLVKVNHAIEDGPAYAAGIRGGDYITAVAGEKTRGKTLDDAVKGMRGLAGDPITVTVLSPNMAPRDVVVVREVVRGRAVRHRIESGLGYVFIETFNNTRLTEDLTKALKSLERDLGGKLPGLVIDVRSNRGGLLDQSVSVSGLFLDGGEVLSSRGRTAEDTERYHAEPTELYPNMPIVVLVNSGSASAAEILAGALQDRGRAVVIGRRTFGKGSVQSVIPLVKHGGALRMTTQRYYTPSGSSIQGRGIMPDMLVAVAPDTGEIRKRFREDSLPNSLLNPDDTDYEEDHDEVIYPPEDWAETKDFQLEKAIEVLKTSKHKTLLAEQSARYKFP
ncbi:S41 family peptidase [Hellea balneolensis]|uniref:S41 family peptidase n=1 Tax=Hellea balneolensis TaxID=287478 RepID=UPI0003F9A634|nr:S41 family peptidase [Hellea balneolensis]